MKTFVYYLILSILFFISISKVYSQNSDHLVISEILYGNVNAKDEFIEIYNPTDQNINLKDIGLKLHIRNSTGSQDLNKTITWNNEVVKAHGFFLFTSKESETYINSADATYSESIVNNGAVYISTSSNKLTDVIDYISWGEHASPEGFEEQIASSFENGQSIERKSNSKEVSELEGNSWDTNGNDFIVRKNPDPQNSLSIIENYNSSDEKNETNEQESSEDTNNKEQEEIINENNCSNEKSIIINEIAWPGITALDLDDPNLSYGHQYQWIELFNTNSQEVNLENWKIVSDDGHEIWLDGLTIKPEQFMILKNTELEIFSNDISPDLIYSDPKNKDDEEIHLSENTKNIKLINSCGDVVETISKIYSGDYSSYRSMARISKESDSDSKDNWFNEKINGSPGENNLYLPLNISIASITANPYHPLPNIGFYVDVLVANLSENSANADDWGIKLSKNNEFLTQQNGVFLENYADTGNISFYVPESLEGEYVLSAEILCESQCGPYSNLDQKITIKPYPYISEIYPKPQNGEYEWIEIVNPTNKEFDVKDTKICIKEKCITLTQTIPATTYYIIQENEYEKYKDDWVPLTNTAEKIFWKQDKKVYNNNYIEGENDPNEEYIFTEDIIDIFEYQNTRIGQSITRNNSIIETTSHITKGKNNDYNQLPFPIIDIQGNGSSEGPAPFTLNFTGENSYDLDEDELLFFWDFGDGRTSNKSNPTAIKYENPGEYNIILTLSDKFGESREISKTIKVLEKLVTNKESKDILKNIQDIGLNTVLFNISNEDTKIKISKISVNDKNKDWIELECQTCEEDISLEGYKLYDDKIFYIFEKEKILNKKNPFRIILNDFEEIDNKVESKKSLQNEKILTETENTITINKKSGLTKTDDQIILFNNKNEIVDAVCWDNFDEKGSEKDDEEKLLNSKAWFGVCVDSRKLNKKDLIINRYMTKKDSNTAIDWEIVNKDIDSLLDVKTQKEELAEKQLKDESSVKIWTDGLRISEIMINPIGPDKNLEWIEIENYTDERINMYGWEINLLKKKYVLEDKFIEPNSFFIIESSISKINFNNSKGSFTFLNPTKKIIQTISYKDVVEGASYSRNTYNYFQWSSIPTPEVKNNILPIEKSKKDSDSDGLFDIIEMSIGTDPFNRDSDFDTYPDGFEIENGYDPTKPDQIKKESFQKYIERKTSSDVKIPKNKEDPLIISGITTPNSTVKIHLHSTPRIFITTSDYKGKWKKIIEKLEKGSHTFQTEIIDKNGIKTNLSKPLEFVLKTDYVISLKDKINEMKRIKRLDEIKTKKQKQIEKSKQKANLIKTNIKTETKKKKTLKTSTKKITSSLAKNKSKKTNLNPENYISKTTKVSQKNIGKEANTKILKDFNPVDYNNKNNKVYGLIAVIFMVVGGIGVFMIKD